MASKLMVKVFEVEDLNIKLEDAIAERLANRLDSSWTFELGIKKSITELKILGGGKEPTDAAEVKKHMQQVVAWQKDFAKFKAQEENAHTNCKKLASELWKDLKILDTMISNYDPAATKKGAIADKERVQERQDKLDSAKGAVERARDLIKDVENRA
jgi:cytochrome c556